MERSDDRIALFTPEAIVPPAPFSVLRRERVDQMVLVDTQACTSPIASGLEWLGKPDIPAMMALAEATKPGPFGPRTIERSETPFLHAFSSNMPAIALYQRLGFVLRRQVHLAVLGVDRVIS